MKKLLLSIFLALSMAASHAWEPKKEVTIVVGFVAGGVVDNIARVIAERFTLQGYSTIVVNQPGATSAIAANRVARAAPDGHTLLLTSTGFLYNKILKAPAATYDTFNDFTHLKIIGTSEQRVFANTSTVNGDMAQVIDDIRSGRKDYTWAASNTATEFTIRLIEDQLKKQFTVVPYNGAPPMIADLIQGRIDIVVDSATSPMGQFIESGKVKVLASSTPKHAGYTTIDQYLPGIVTHNWFGLSLPADAPDDIVNFYNDLITKSINHPDTKSKLVKLKVNLPDQHSTWLVPVIKRDLLKYQPLADKLSNK